MLPADFSGLQQQFQKCHWRYSAVERGRQKAYQFHTMSFTADIYSGILSDISAGSSQTFPFAMRLVKFDNGIMIAFAVNIATRMRLAFLSVTSEAIWKWSCFSPYYFIDFCFGRIVFILFLQLLDFVIWVLIIIQILMISRCHRNVSAHDVANFFESYETSKTATRANSKYMADYIRTMNADGIGGLHADQSPLESELHCS